MTNTTHKCEDMVTDSQEKKGTSTRGVLERLKSMRKRQCLIAKRIVQEVFSINILFIQVVVYFGL